ncbi:MAG TPA: ribbon-helix-helix domain-containing protein [Actinomycetota bacterium]|nr:ribbon-helix-helix domain-containing protein [Actinomycetota bacterium]
MRLHVYLDDELVRELDELVGDRGRSAFIEEAVARRLDAERRRKQIWSAVGSISDEGHAWDPDPGAWVRETRRRETEARERRLRDAMQD